MSDTQMISIEEQKVFDTAIKDFCVKAWQLNDILPANFFVSVLPLESNTIGSILEAYKDVCGNTIYVHNADYDKKDEISDKEQEVGYVIMDLGEDERGYRSIYVFCGSRIESYPNLKQALIDLSEGKEI